MPRVLRPHKKADCTAASPTCANCGGNHASTYAGCPAAVGARATQEVERLTYAEKVKLPAERSDCLRLACSLTTSLTTLLMQAKLENDPVEICKNVAESVSRHYKVNVPWQYLQKQCLVNRAASATDRATSATGKEAASTAASTNQRNV